MKKLLIIATSACLFIISCKKADVTPIAASVNSKAAIQNKPAPPDHCYLLRNTETIAGDYWVTYTDCTNTIQKEPLAAGDRLMLCLRSGTVQTNFAYTLADRGDCISTRP